MSRKSTIDTKDSHTGKMLVMLENNTSKASHHKNNSNSFQQSQGNNANNSFIFTENHTATSIDERKKERHAFNERAHVSHQAQVTQSYNKGKGVLH